MPVHELLGGRVREVGFDTFKLNGCEELAMLDSGRPVDRAVAVVAKVRKAFGNAIDFGLDFHGRVAAPMAKPLLKALEPYRPLFVEEPVLTEQVEQVEHYLRLAAATSIPLAACLQLDFVAWNVVLQEQSMGIHYNRCAELLDDVLNKQDFRIQGGYIDAPTRLGLGVELNEERVAQIRAAT